MAVDPQALSTNGQAALMMLRIEVVTLVPGMALTMAPASWMILVSQYGYGTEEWLTHAEGA